MEVLWEYYGQKRPPFAEEPAPGQESVWDYPRPPVLRADSRRVVVRARERVLADSGHALRVLETASPPTLYVPAADVDLECLVAAEGRSMCEWKGEAYYWALQSDPSQGAVAWAYAQPPIEFVALTGYLAFYPGRVECRLGGERVRPQPGGFYGGWVTDEVVGPFKGKSGTGTW